MNLKDVIAKLPEADRAEAEKAITDAIAAGNPLAGVTTNEQAAEFIRKNPLFKGAHDSDISVKVEEHDKRFMADKFPKLLEAEIKKLTGPETDPLKIRIAELEAKDTKREAEATRDKQRAVALKLAAAEGIPVDDIERFLGEDDAKTTESTTAYAKRMKAWRDEAVEKALKERLGNVGAPKGGTVIPPADLKTQYEAAAKAGNGMEMLRLKSLIQAANVQE